MMIFLQKKIKNKHPVSVNTKPKNVNTAEKSKHNQGAEGRGEGERGGLMNVVGETLPLLAYKLVCFGCTERERERGAHECCWGDLAAAC